MSGFFKKLFNRITGKKEEAAPELEALPAPGPESLPEPTPELEPAAEPAPEPAPEPVAVEPEPQQDQLVAARPQAQEKPSAKTAQPKKPEPKKAIPVKPESKKSAPKKATPTKPEPKKPEPKKPEAKKPEPAKLPPKKAEVKAAEKPPVAAPTIKVEPPPPSPPPPEPVALSKVGALRKQEAARAPTPVPAADAGGWFGRLRQGLSKSSKSIGGSLGTILSARKLQDSDLLDLEDVMLQADLGLPLAERIVEAVRAGRYEGNIDAEEVKRILAREVAKVLKPVEVPFNFGSEKPFVVLVVGVNGAGKTTTIGKLGAIATQEGFKVMFAACDTFRAAAIEQLTVWGQRIGAKTISRPTGADAAGLAFDAMREAKEGGADILFIDTAGRLQNKQYLMDELDKVVRVIKKQDDTAPHAVLLVLDATTGQNAMAQADIFTKVAGVTGLIMTKLDGTARGGILVAIAERFKIPVHAIGVGEKIEDLQPFDADGFARAIAGLDEA